MGSFLESCQKWQDKQDDTLISEINKQQKTEIFISQNPKPTSFTIVFRSFMKIFDLQQKDFDIESRSHQEYIESNNSSQLSIFSINSVFKQEIIKSKITGCYRLKLSLVKKYCSEKQWITQNTSLSDMSYYLPIISERKVHYKNIIKNIVKQRSLTNVRKIVGFGLNCSSHEQCSLPREAIFLFSNAEEAFKNSQKIPLQDQKFYQCIIECNVREQVIHLDTQSDNQGDCIVESDDDIQVTAILLRELKLFVA